MGSTYFIPRSHLPLRIGIVSLHMALCLSILLLLKHRKQYFYNIKERGRGKARVGFSFRDRIWSFQFTPALAGGRYDPSPKFFENSVKTVASKANGFLPITFQSSASSGIVALLIFISSANNRYWNVLHFHIIMV